MARAIRHRRSSAPWGRGTALGDASGRDGFPQLSFGRLGKCCLPSVAHVMAAPRAASRCWVCVARPRRDRCEPAGRRPSGGAGGAERVGLAVFFGEARSARGARAEGIEGRGVYSCGINNPLGQKARSPPSRRFAHLSWLACVTGSANRFQGAADDEWGAPPHRRINSATVAGLPALRPAAKARRRRIIAARVCLHLIRMRFPLLRAPMRGAPAAFPALGDQRHRRRT